MFKWEKDEASWIIFPPKFNFEFVIVDEEVEVAGGAKVKDNA